MPKAKVGDVNIYYEIHGKGEPLVFVNGKHMSMALLYRHIPVFSREYRVIAFDNRGAGRSDSPDIPYTIKMMADDLAGLLDAIHVDSAHIIGYSMGVKIAQEFALHPERVLSLIMACPGSDVPDPVRPDTATRNERDWIETLPLKEKVRAFLKHVVNEEFINNNPRLAEKMVKIMYEGYGPPHGRTRQQQASGSYIGYERQPEIKAPTLVIAGSADKSCPAENARILASRIPGAEFVMLENMRHFFMWEDFDKSNQIMLDFLKRHHRSAD